MVSLSTLSLLAGVAAFYLFSVSSGVLNKQAMATNVLPAVLSSAHLLTAVVCDSAILATKRLFRGQTAAVVSPSDPALAGGGLEKWLRVFKMFWPVSVSMVLAKLATYMSYQTMSMPLTQTAKATEPLFNVVLAFFLFRERQSALVVGSLVVIGVGVAIASARDSTCNTLGLMFALASAAFKVLQNICLKRVMDTKHFSFFEVHLYGAVASTLLLLPVLGTELMMATESILPVSALPVILLSSAAQFFSSLSSYFVLSMTHHLTFTVINCLKRVVLIFGGMVYFHIELSTRNVSGASLALSGLVMYKIARTRLKRLQVQSHRDQLRDITKQFENPPSAASSVASISLPGTPDQDAFSTLFSSRPSTTSASQSKKLNQAVGDLLQVLSPSTRQRRKTDGASAFALDSDDDGDDDFYGDDVAASFHRGVDSDDEASQEIGLGDSEDDHGHGGSMLDAEDVALLRSDDVAEAAVV